MTKGLQRSLKRGSKSSSAIVKDVLDLTGVRLTVSAAGAGIAFGSTTIGGFPEGNILIHGIGGTVGFDGNGTGNVSATWEGDFGIGTTPADDATITGTDVDILASKAIGPATLELIDPARHVEAGQGMFDNTDGTLEINLNLLIDAADFFDGQSEHMTLAGLLEISYVVLGND